MTVNEMNTITNYNGIDFTYFLSEMNIMYKMAAEAYNKGDSHGEKDYLNIAFGMKCAFLNLFGDKLDLRRTENFTEHVIVERGEQ